MKRTGPLAIFLVLAGMLQADSAEATWKLVTERQPIAVAKSSLKVSPDTAWNRWTVRPIKKSELWTLDGAALNELYFVSGLIPGETLYRDAKKKDHPLPAMRGAMQLTDIPDFVENSMRVALDTSVFKIETTEPYRFAGHEGVKFSYSYAVASSPLTRKGMAAGTVVGNQLYLITFTAPSLYYFDRDRPKAEAVFNSATF